MQLWKRFLCLVLVTAMCTGLLPATAFAAHSTTPKLAATGYDPESGVVTIAEVPEGTATLLLAGYKEEQMVFSQRKKPTPSPAV